MRLPENPRAPSAHSPALILASALLLLALAGCGGGGGGSGGAAGPAAEPELAFVANGNDGAISRLRLDPATGDLVHDGYHVLPTGSVETLALHPSGAFLYAAGESSIFALRIDPPTGALSQVVERPTGTGSARIAFHPDLPVLYLARRASASIQAFSIDLATGGIEPLASLGSADVVDIDLEPSGSHLFAVNRTPRTVTRHAVLPDGSLGAGTVVHTDPSSAVTALAIHPAGDRAYLALDAASNNVVVLAVDPAGNFTLLDTEGVGSGPTAIAVDTAGAFAFVGSSGNDSVSSLAIDPVTGLLDFLASDPTVENPAALVLSPDGTRLQVGSATLAEIDTFVVGSDGSLSATQRAHSRGAVRGLDVRAGSGSVAPPSERVYVPYGSDDTIRRFDRDAATGALGNPWSVPAGDDPRSVAFHPSGRFAYALSTESADVEVFAVDPATGDLESRQVVSVLSQVAPNDGTDWLIRAAVEPSGRFLYLLDNRTDLSLSGRIFWYSIAGDGTLAFGGSVTTGMSPENFAIHPAGKHLYVMASWGDQIQTFEIATATGALTIKNTLGGYDRPVQAAISSSGTYLYVGVENEDRVFRFFLQPTSGLPVNPQWYQKALPAGTRGIALHPGGQTLYLTSDDATIARFTIHSATGALAYADQTSSNGAEWLSVAADGRHAYGLAPDGVQVFALDPVTLAPTSAGATELIGVGPYQRSLALE
jgi:6-phosphogluconolactonase